MIPNLSFRQIFNLSQIKTSAPGGFWLLYFVPVEGVSYIQKYNPVTGTVANIYFRADATIYEAWFAPNKKGYKEEQKQSEAGPYIDFTVDAFIPYESLDLHRGLNNMMHKKYILTLSTHAEGGMIRILGNLDNPVKFSHAFNSGHAPKDIPGTTVRFTWQNPDKAPLFVPALGPGPNAIGASDPDPVVGGGLPTM